jgi:hypothetical protein
MPERVEVAEGDLLGVDETEPLHPPGCYLRAPTCSEN